MVNEAIIIAGGLGTRLRSVVKDVPKPMANINGRPFLEYLLDFLAKYNIKKVILAVGYKYKVIKNFFGNKYNDIDIIYSIEDEPLGTGGAIRKAIEKVEKNKVIVLNGDTYFKIDLEKFVNFHNNIGAEISIALKRLLNFNRYGTININNNHRIIDFSEKEEKKEGLINGGVYILEKNLLIDYDKFTKFSFETDFLEKRVSTLNIYGKLFDVFFIDIGVPSDIRKAKKQLN